MAECLISAVSFAPVVRKVVGAECIELLLDGVASSNSGPPLELEGLEDEGIGPLDYLRNLFY